ncbi:hypothetical protein CHU98_g3090 [Xylaria longipes]|nr:hypothetical protein CHU98_g3090 [Xylaria longipes]
MEALREEIAQAKKDNAYDKGSFVPNDLLNKLFTEDVKEQINLICPEIAVDGLTKVIATLVYNEKLTADVLKSLHDAGFTDQYLPIKLSQKKDVFKSARENRIFKPFLVGADSMAFERDQWLFCSPSFGSAKHEELDPRCPIPIVHCSKKSLRGSFGEVFEVQMHHAHLRVKPQPVSPIWVSKIPNADFLETEENNPVLAMKKMISDSDQEYDQEREALQRIQRLQHPHLIEMIASFRRGRDHFFLFPWANGGDLRDWWERNSNLERTPAMVRWVLEQMKGIASAVKELHFPSERTVEDENGRHGDLKPGNIVVFNDQPGENPRRTLCITDAGLARFHENITSKRMTGTNTNGGSIEYGPPDPRREDKKVKISRLYDMWSLGCVFLEFIVWVLGGWTEVESFRARRKSKRRDGEFYQKTITGYYRVLPEVKRCMNSILSDKRCQGDNCFRDVVNIIRNHLLRIGEKHRTTSQVLERLFLSILEKANGSPSYLCGPNAGAGFRPGPIPEYSVIGNVARLLI